MSEKQSKKMNKVYREQARKLLAGQYGQYAKEQEFQIKIYRWTILIMFFIILLLTTIIFVLGVWY